MQEFLFTLPRHSLPELPSLSPVLNSQFTVLGAAQACMNQLLNPNPKPQQLLKYLPVPSPGSVDLVGPCEEVCF